MPAFAVTEPGGFIIIETVSPTERAAMVNWLVVRAGLMITEDWTDARIRAAFAGASQARGVELIRVQVLGEHALPPGAVMMILALLEKLGGSAFVHDSELAELHPAWRLVSTREPHPEGVKLEIDKSLREPPR
jgi:hypothetical protein